MYFTVIMTGRSQEMLACVLYLPFSEARREEEELKEESQSKHASAYSGLTVCGAVCCSCFRDFFVDGCM